jgi:hypothetical protein
VKIKLERTQKNQRIKNLWKDDHPPQDPELRWVWIAQVEEHLFGSRKMQDELLKAWGFSPYKRKDRRKKPLRDKMRPISLRARDRELKILELRFMNLSFRQIGARLGISHVAAWKRYWSAMHESLLAEQERERWLNSIREQLQGWIRYHQNSASTASEKEVPAPHHNG